MLQGIHSSFVTTDHLKICLSLRPKYVCKSPVSFFVHYPLHPRVSLGSGWISINLSVRLLVNTRRSLLLHTPTRTVSVCDIGSVTPPLSSSPCFLPPLFSTSEIQSVNNRSFGLKWRREVIITRNNNNIPSLTISDPKKGGFIKFTTTLSFIVETV